MSNGVEIIQDSIKGGGYSGRAVIGIGAAVQLNTHEADLQSGVLIRCPAANAGNLFVGFGSDITADGTDSTSGVIIEPGGDLSLPIRRLNDLWFTASVASTKLFWIAQ